MEQISSTSARPKKRGRPMRVTSWLGIGAMTLGVGAVLVGGAGAAHADSGDSDTAGAGASAPKSGAQGHSKRSTTGSQARIRTPKPAAASNSGASAVKDTASSAADIEVPTVAPSPAAAVKSFGRTANPAAATSASTVSSVPSASASAGAAATASTGSCSECWGAGAPTIAQGITTAVNHWFNSAYSILGDSPNAISAFVEGALVLLRRALFFVPTGLSTLQVGTELTIQVNTGSVAYFRQSGSNIQLADNPLFWGAKDFAATSVSDVVMGNSGTTGCAGLMFTEGTLDASLTTSGIDSINFGETAAATGAVQATLNSGSIALTNAIRGYGGVTVNGALTLVNDVEIDAATADVQFNGTVDAATAGEQSLLVTALGTTTFASAVGGLAALSSLTTRGIAPLNIVQSNDTKSVPLYFMPNYDTTGKIQVKYGIEVAIGTNAPRFYVFDTGGQGFFAGYNEAYWQGVTLGTNETSNTYTSGNFFDGVATTTSVTIGSGAQSVTTAPIQIAAITDGGNHKKKTVFDFTNEFATPVDDRFVGDFGASWGIQPVDNQTQGLSSVLFQLPGNLSTGFIVQLGPIGSDQQLTMGITDALRDQFTYAIPVTQATGDNAGFYPVSGFPFLDQFGFTGQYQVKEPGSTTGTTLGTDPYPGCAQQCLPSIIDSGAPSTGVRLPNAPTPYPYSTDEDKALQSDIDFSAVFPTTQGRPALTWQFLSGTNSSVDAVGYSGESGAAFSGQNVNTGLNLYNQFDVMFDTELQVIWLRPNDGQATVNLGSVTTTGAQDYAQNAVLNGTYSTGGGAFTVGGVSTLGGTSTVINAGAGAVTFGGTVDGTTAGRQLLTVNSSGAATFMREVGNLVALASFTTDAGGSTATTGVVTTGGQTYGDAIEIGGLYKGSTFSAAQAATLAAPTAITANQGGSITFNGTLDSGTRVVPTDTGSTTVDLGYALTVTADAGVVAFNGVVGGASPLGGLTIGENTRATASAAVNLDGVNVTSEKKGLVVQDGATIDFTSGGTITDFEDSGVEFQGSSQNSSLEGFEIYSNGKSGIRLAEKPTHDGSDDAVTDDAVHDFTGTVIADNQIYSNGESGIDFAVPVKGLIVRGNEIGQVTSAATPPVDSNSHGISLSEGDYDGTVIEQNVIHGNTGSGIAALGGATNLSITENVIEENGKDGIELAGGSFISTVISTNTISSNASAGISIGEKAGDTAAHDATVVHNTITDNGDDGVKINGSYSIVEFNIISGNTGDGVEVRRSASVSNEILSNSIISNTGGGITLLNNSNGGQPAPVLVSATSKSSGTKVEIVANVLPVEGYTGKFTVQVFANTVTSAADAQGQTLIGTIEVDAGEFTRSFDITSTDQQWITLTATPKTGDLNSSEFSNAEEITA